MPPPPDPGDGPGPTIHVNLHETLAGDSGPGLDSGVTTLLERAVHATLDAEGVRGGELSVTLLDDAGIQAMNRTYLDRDSVTDVLSFALHGADEAMLADVYIGLHQAYRQADELDVPRREELVRLAIHGTLHALGYDHPEENRDASPLFRRQEELVHRVLAAEGATRQDPPGSL